MKLTSLILPLTSAFRYLRKGRIALGFKDGVLGTKRHAGSFWGLCSLTSTDQQTITSDAQTISKRFVVFSGRTAATAATFPAASGDIREVIVQNANTSSGAVTVTSPSTNMYSAASASASATNVIAIATCARFLSDGTSWFRVTT